MHKILSLLSRWSALAVASIAILAGMEWWLDAAALKPALPDMPTMKPSTASMLLALGVALLLSQSNDRPRSHRNAALLCAAYATLAGTLYLFAPIDADNGPAWLAAPSAATSVCLVLSGVAVMLLQRRPPPAPVIGLLALFVGLLALHRLLVFAAGTNMALATGPFGGMALHTALGIFLLAALGILPHRRLPFAGYLCATDIQGHLLRRVLPWTALAPVLLATVTAGIIETERQDAGFMVIVLVTLLGTTASGMLYVLSSALHAADGKRRLAEASLRERERSTRAVLDAAPNAIVVVDAEGDIVQLNRCAERLFGYDAEEMLGKPIEMLVPERLRPAHEMLRKAYAADPTPRLVGADRVVTGRHKDGHEI